MVKFFLSAVAVLACSTFAGAQQCTNGSCSLPSKPRAVFVIPHETGLPVLVCPPKINSTNCSCVSTLGACPCVDGSTVSTVKGSLPDPLTVRLENYPFPDHVTGWTGVRVNKNESDSWVSVSRPMDYNPRTKNVGGVSVDSRRDIIVLNGERYNPRGATKFPRDEFAEELTMWIAWTGPCKLNVRDGVYYFESLTGEELKYRLDFADPAATEPWQKNWREEMGYVVTTPRLATMSQCRRAWEEYARFLAKKGTAGVGPLFISSPETLADLQRTGSKYTFGEYKYTPPSAEWIRKQNNLPTNAVSSQPNTITPRPVVVSAVHTGDYHTHTCSHGHTWNHTQDGGTHRCPYRDPVTGAICGEYQNRVDSSTRAVNTGGFLPHGWETHTGSPSLGVSSGGCANGSCSAPSSGQSSTRWYPGKRLGR